MRKLLLHIRNVSIVRRAFSMIELAVFITVFSFIVAAFALSINSDVANKKVSITQERIDKIYNALGLFVAQNSRLPCPGKITDVLNNASYGDEGGCVSGTGFYVSGDIVYGMVPIKALGLSLQDSVDGFGSKFVYAMDKNFATSNQFNLDGGITIKNFINNASSNVSTNSLFVIMSYGPNKRGAYNMNSENNISASSDVDEIDNGFASLNNDFIAFSDRADGSFDDIVFYRKDKSDFLRDFDIYNLFETNRTESND